MRLDGVTIVVQDGKLVINQLKLSLILYTLMTGLIVIISIVHIIHLCVGLTSRAIQ